MRDGMNELAPPQTASHPPRPASANAPLFAGIFFEVPHPFCWEEASRPGDDPEGPATIYFMSWRPGTRDGPPEPPDGGGMIPVADGMGLQILTVVSVHKPGRYPARVFYTRKWRDPAGHEFGKPALRMKTVSAFTRLRRGWRHEYELSGSGRPA